jgi:hypothetical protein
VRAIGLIISVADAGSARTSLLGLTAPLCPHGGT